MKSSLLLGKAISFLKDKRVIINSWLLKRWFSWGSDGILIGKNFLALGGLKIACTNGGSISIGDNFMVSKGCTIVCQGGRLVIGENVFLGQGVIIVCSNSIYIGSDSLLAEYVVVRDQDHLSNTRPIRNAGFVSSPIEIGVDGWIGAKASVLRGGIVGDGSIIGAHSLVRSSIPSFVLAAGSPAEIRKTLN